MGQNYTRRYRVNNNFSRTVDNEVARAVSPADVKLCELCGALNFHANAECFVCGWRGTFARTGDAVRLAWERLRGEYKCVTLSHVTGKSVSPIAELGAPAPQGVVRRVLSALAVWGRTLRQNRDRRAAEREAGLHPRRSLPPNGLGV